MEPSPAKDASGSHGTAQRKTDGEDAGRRNAVVSLQRAMRGGFAAEDMSGQSRDFAHERMTVRRNRESIMTQTPHDHPESPLYSGDTFTQESEPFDLHQQCERLICPSCTVKTEADDTRLRALAELENVKKRLQREKEEQVKYAAENVLADLLPVLDSLDLAIQYGSQDPACASMLTGVSMTRKLFLDALKPHGLAPVGEPGEPFDPEVHEAVAHEARDDMDEGCVASLHQRGYRLKERLLRPAKVSVSRKAQ